MNMQEAFSNFGKYISFSVDNSEQKLGKLINIGLEDDEIEIGIDIDSTIQYYPCEEIVLKESYSKKNEIQQRIQQRVSEFRENMELFVLKLYDEEEIRNLLEKKCDKIAVLHFMEFIEQYRPSRQRCESVLNELDMSGFSSREKDLIEGVSALKIRDYNKAHRIFADAWIKNPSDTENCINLLLIAKEMRNDVLCFYLLKQIFRTEGIWSYPESCIKSLWWKFVRYSVRYGNFSILREIELSRANAGFVADALIYIFYACNMGNLCEEMIYAGELTDENTEEKINKIRFFLYYLPEDSESYYKRGEYGIERILREYGSDNSLFSEQQMYGYIYEYVDDKKYGYVMGADFQNYFYRENDASESLMDDIREKFSKIEVNEQDLIKVQFTMKRDGEKRAAAQLTVFLD